MIVHSPRLPAILFHAIHSFLPETLTKKVTVISQKCLAFPRLFLPPPSVVEDTEWRGVVLAEWEAKQKAVMGGKWSRAEERDKDYDRG